MRIKKIRKNVILFISAAVAVLAMSGIEKPMEVHAEEPEAKTFYLTVEDIKNAMNDRDNIYNGVLGNQYDNPFFILQPGNYVIDEVIDLNELRVEGISFVDGVYHFSGDGKIIGYHGNRYFNAKDFNFDGSSELYFDDFYLSGVTTEQNGTIYFNGGTYSGYFTCTCEVNGGEFPSHISFLGDQSIINEGTFYNGLSIGAEYDDDGCVINDIDVRSGGITAKGNLVIIYDGTINGTLECNAKWLEIYGGTYNGEEYAITGALNYGITYIYGGTFEGEKAAVYREADGDWYGYDPLELLGGTFKAGTEGTIIWNRMDVFPSELNGEEAYELIYAECTGDAKIRTKEIKSGPSYASVLYEENGEDIILSDHLEEIDPAVEPSCMDTGLSEGSHCSVCNEVILAQEEVEALGHSFTNYISDNNATTEEAGTLTAKCDRCEERDTIPDPAGPIELKNATVTRLFGENRYETSYKIADALKETLGVELFDTVIVANGKNFPDALAGSYLAGKINAPILMASEKDSYARALRSYIRENLKPNGTIYILGGTEVVPDSILDGLTYYRKIRLGGTDRYETNLLILAEAGVKGEEILICTGKNYADSLSASAVGKPILLLNNKQLKSEQIKFLQKHEGSRLYIIGGEGAISNELEKVLSDYGPVERISGESRYETSAEVARKFFEKPDAAVFASGKNFPDGLCGGPLALGIKNTPLILTSTNKTDKAETYISEKMVTEGIVLGGDTLIADSAIRTIFQWSESVEIK